MVDVGAVIRRNIAVPVAVQVMDLGRPQLLGIGLARRGTENALAVLLQMVNIVRRTDGNTAVGAVDIVIPILKAHDKRVGAVFGDRVPESFGHIYLTIDIIHPLLV